MAQQLVYTSAAKLLDAGRSGYGTVARSKSLSPLLVSTIERVSQFANIRGTERSRVIFSHRRITAANNRFQLLSRIADAGADYTGRTNHIAHHLIVSQQEMTRAAARGITPADVLLHFQWLSSWDGAPRFFGPEDDVQIEQSTHTRGKASARSEWRNLTGTPVHARLLAWDGAPRTGVLLVPQAADPLLLLAEALSEFGAQAWSRTFTTSLETTDEMSDFDWVVSSPGKFREIEARCGSRTCYDLAQPATLPVPPEPVIAKREIQPQITAAFDSGQISGTQATRADTASPIHVKIKAGSGRSARVPVPTIAPTTRKPYFTTTAAVAAVLVLMGVILWKIAVPDTRDTSLEGDVVQSNDWRNSLDTMKQAGICEERAKEVANGAKDGTANQWAEFISNFIGEIKNQNIERIEDIAKTQKSPHETCPRTNTGWLEFLTQGRNKIAEYSAEPPKELKDRLVKLAEISNSLRKAARTGFSSAFTEQDCIDFDARITKHFLLSLAPEKEKLTEKQRLEIVDAIKKTQFQVSNFPGRYPVLAEFIKNRFGQVQIEKLVKGIKTSGVDGGQINDTKGYLLAQRKNGHDLSKEKTKKITSSNYVPDEVKKRFKKTENGSEKTDMESKNPSSKENEPKGPDFLDVPEKEIIVVSRSQLKAGVKVKLLEAWMRANPSVDDLKQNIKIDGAPFEILVAVADQNYFSENWDDKQNVTNQKLHKNGKYSHADPEVLKISLSTAYKGESCEAWIVIDDDKKHSTPLFEELTFRVRKKNEHEGVINGDLANLVKTTRMEGESNPGLKYVAAPAISGAWIDGTNGQMRVRFEQKKQPEFFLENEYHEIIESSLNNINKAYESKGNIVGEKEKALEKLINNIIICVASEMISKEPILDGAKNVNVNNLPNVRKWVTEKTGISCSVDVYENKKSFEEREKNKKEDERKSYNDHKKEVNDNNIKSVLMAYGAESANEILNKYAGTKNGLSDLETAGLDKIQKLVSNLLSNTKPPGPEPSFEQKTSQLNTIYVRTPSGRVLFKATRTQKE